MATPTQPVKVYYGKPMLPDVSRVLACLYEKEVKFELIDMYEGQTINPDLIKFQASRAAVSGFEDGNIRLFESRGICRHIVDRYANRGNKYLLGRDLLERSSIEQWLKSEENIFDPPSWALIFHLAFDVEPDRALITQSERKLKEVLDVYEQRLGESRFLAGDEFSLADLSHLPNSHYLAKSEEWGYLFEERKNVRKWWGEISSRHSWQEVVKILDRVGIRGKDVKKTSNERNHFLIHKKLDLHLPDQFNMSSALSSQTEDLNTQSTNQPATAVAPASEVQGKDAGPTTKEDSNGQSTAHRSTTNAQSSTRIVRPEAPPSSKPEKTTLPASASPSVQKQGKEDSAGKEATAQPAKIGAPSNETKGSPSSARSATQLPDNLASKEQEKNIQKGKADDARKSIAQEGRSGQKQGQADSGSPMTHQIDHLDSESSSKETAVDSMTYQEKENGGKATPQAESEKSIAEKATAGTQPTTGQPAPGVQSSKDKDQIDQKPIPKQSQTDAQTDAIPGEKIEKNAQSTSQGDSEGKSILQKQTIRDAPDVQASQKKEENSQRTLQDNSPSKTNMKPQELTDALSSPKEGSVKEKQATTMDKADHGGQGISEISPRPDSQSSTKQKQDAQQETTKQGSSEVQSPSKQNPPDTMLNKKQEETAQSTGQEASKGPPISQQATDASSSKPPTRGDQSNQKQEQVAKQSLPENQAAESIGNRDTTADNSSNAPASAASTSETNSTGESGNRSGTSSQSKD